MANTYPVGSNINFWVIFRDFATKALVDPTTVTFSIESPEIYKAIVTYVFGVNPELVKDSAGHYHVNYVLDYPGDWYYQFTAAGTYIGADEKRVCVRVTRF